MAGIRMFLTTLCLAYFLGGSFADDESNNNCDCEQMKLVFDTLKKLFADGMLNEDTFKNLQSGMANGNIRDILDTFNSKLDIMGPIAGLPFDPNVMDLIYNLDSESRTEFLKALPTVPENIQKFVGEILKNTNPASFSKVANIFPGILSGATELPNFAKLFQESLSPELMNSISYPNIDFHMLGLPMDIVEGLFSNVLGGVGNAVSGVVNGALGAVDGALGVVGGALGGVTGGGDHGKHSVSSGQGGSGKGQGENGGLLAPVEGVVGEAAKTAGGLIRAGIDAVGETADAVGKAGNAAVKFATGGLPGDSGTKGGSDRKRSFFPG